MATYVAVGDSITEGFCDPAFEGPKPLRGRSAVFNANLWSIARTHQDEDEEPSPRLSSLSCLHAYALPWIGRRVRGVSAGDGMSPKPPVPKQVSARR
ncbi:MAG: hypothetical protein ABWX59_10620 [Microbacteriaceae bacterium]